MQKETFYRPTIWCVVVKGYQKEQHEHLSFVKLADKQFLTLCLVHGCTCFHKILYNY